MRQSWKLASLGLPVVAEHYRQMEASGIEVLFRREPFGCEIRVRIRVAQLGSDVEAFR